MFSKKEIYIGSVELNFDQKELAEDLLKTSSIDKNTAEKLSFYIWSTKLTFSSKNKLIQVESLGDGNYSTIQIPSWGNELEFIETHNHEINFFTVNESGPHQLGGKPPNNFHFPTHDYNVSFQYIGLISKRDLNFAWLPFEELHLIFPLYGDSDSIFLDYTDPNNPVILEYPMNSDLDFSLPIINQNHAIEFESKHLELISWKTFDNQKLELLEIGLEIHGLYGASGIPYWIQRPQSIRCPKTNKLMRFVCEFDTSHEIKISKLDPGIPREQLPYNFGILDFFGGGKFYVFVEPESKIVCALIQNT